MPRLPSIEHFTLNLAPGCRLRKEAAMLLMSGTDISEDNEYDDTRRRKIEGNEEQDDEIEILDLS